MQEGILSYTTYKGDLGGAEMDPHAVVLDYEGLQLQREFYSPKYENAQNGSRRLPDFRNLLAWDPNIVIGKSGETQISFYSSDRKGKYVGSIEGINQNGLAGSTRFFFEVE